MADAWRAQVEQAHSALHGAVADANALFAVVEGRLPQVEQVPGPEVVRPLLVLTGRIATAIADLLDLLDALLAEGVPPASLGAALDDIQREGGSVLHAGPVHQGCCGPEETALGRLRRFHELLHLTGQVLFAQRRARPYLLDQARTLWVRLKYTGGDAWGGGLLLRLERVASLGTGPVWVPEDLSVLRQVAHEAETLASLSEDELETRARASWCAQVDGWLAQVDTNPGPAATMLSDLARHPPAEDDAVASRKVRLAELYLLDADLRASLRG